MSDLVEIIARALARVEFPDEKEYPNLDYLWQHLVERVPAFIAALNAAGLVIVPKEPTEAMLAATAEDGRWKFSANGMDWVRGCWSAMISQTLAADGSSKNPTEDRE